MVPSDEAEPPREKDFGVNEKGLRKLVCVAVLSCCSSPMYRGRVGELHQPLHEKMLEGLPSVGAAAAVEACVGTPVPLLALR